MVLFRHFSRVLDLVTARQLLSLLAPLVAGVPQGSPISTLCFSLFIDDLTEVLEFSKYHMYTDDLPIYHSRPREMLFEFFREVNSYLSKVFEMSGKEPGPYF
jgi:hypothetical protein